MDYIYICVNPFALENSKSHFNRSKQKEDLAHFFVYEEFLIDSDTEQALFYPVRSGESYTGLKRYFIKIRSAKLSFKKICCICSKKKGAFFVITGLKEVLSNFCYFRLCRKGVFFCQYDGTLNEYQTSVDFGLFLRMILLSLFCSIFGVFYVPFLGKISGIDRGVRAIPMLYSKVPNASAYSDTTKVLVIVGIEAVSQFFSNKEFEAVEKKFFDFCQKVYSQEKPERILYKPHPRFSNIYSSIRMFSGAYSQIEVMDASEPLEAVCCIDSFIIASLDSSAAINIKKIRPDQKIFFDRDTSSLYRNSEQLDHFVLLAQPEVLV